MRSPAVVALTVLACLLQAAVADAAGRYTARRLGIFKEPVFLTAPKGAGYVFVVERHGRVRVVRDGKILRRPFLDIRKDVFIEKSRESQDQRGLLSIALAPDYATSGLLYAVYTQHDDTVQVDEFRRSATNRFRVDPASRRHVINAGFASPYHHGGQLQFGPDGMLYISTGTAVDKFLPQNLGDLHGKILRIDPHPSGDQPYTVPPDNPFVGVDGVRPEIYLYGLRNPWRFSFDRKTGDMTIGDVGGETAEELDFLPRGTGAGSNFGFPIIEGNQRMYPGDLQNYVPPVIEHLHKDGLCGWMGGYVVRDRKLRGLYGRYVYGDFCSMHLRVAKLGPGATARGDRQLALRVPYLVSFGEDGHGRLYAISFGGGVYRIDTVSRPHHRRR